MKNLGKILFIIFLIPHAIYAGVVATVDSKKVQLGEIVTYSLDLSGEDIKKPNITTLCGENVLSSSSSTSIKIVDGEYKKTYVLSYTFLPKKSCTIDSLSVAIDSKLEATQAIDIEVVKVLSSKDSDFLLTLSVDKDEVFVGEPFELTLVFKQKNGAEVVDNKFIAPTLNGFWLKGESKPTRENDGEFSSTKIVYTMAPQRVGNLDITSAQMKIASRSNTRDPWGSFMPNIKWRSYFSNDLNITSKPLPQGVSLVGDFTIFAEASATEVNANEALNLTIKVVGDGNLEDIKSFKPYIDGVSVFDEKIVIQNGVLTQKIAFVADSDFKIPPFSLKYLSLASKEIKEVSTKEIDIKVKHSKAKKELNIKRDETTKDVIETTEVMPKLDIFLAIGIFIVGMACGIIIMILRTITFTSRDKKLNIKDHKLLLVKLLPYKENDDVKKIVDVLENNLYSKEKKELDKKALKELINKYEIK